MQSSLFRREQALGIAEHVCRICAPYIVRSEICGGIRREIEEVHDVDLVFQVEESFLFQLITYLQMDSKVTSLKSHRRRIDVVVGGVPTEIYLAFNNDEFEILKLVRTGSQLFMERFAGMALYQGMALRFKDEKKGPLFGLFPVIKQRNKETRKIELIINPLRNVVKGKNEREIIELVMDNYKEPRDR